MGAQGRSKWEDLPLSYSARKMAFFTFLKVWFEFGVLQMRKDGTQNVTDLPEATQRVKGKAEERIHWSSVGVQRCAPHLTLNYEPTLSVHSPPHTASPQGAYQTIGTPPQLTHLSSIRQGHILAT